MFKPQFTNQRMTYEQPFIPKLTRLYIFYRFAPPKKIQGDSIQVAVPWCPAHVPKTFHPDTMHHETMYSVVVLCLFIFLCRNPNKVR